MTSKAPTPMGLPPSSLWRRWIVGAICTECGAFRCVLSHPENLNGLTYWTPGWGIPIDDPCWSCGELDLFENDVGIVANRSYRLVTARWVSTAVWWQPWTWGDGHFQTRPYVRTPRDDDDKHERQDVAPPEPVETANAPVLVQGDQ